MSRKLNAPSKINIFLEVTGKRSDGYHNILTLMAKISLGDVISIQESSQASSFTVKFSDDSVPVDGSNTVVKALRLLSSHGVKTRGISIHVEKRIPSGAGLGGASTDAASVLKYLGKGIPIPYEDIAYLVGGDVPFFVANSRWAWIEGVGEMVTPVTRHPKLFINLIIPPFSISTAWAYRMIDEADSYTPFFPQKRTELEFEDVKDLMFNRFLYVLQNVHSGIRELSEFLSENLSGTPWSMSGSGSAFFTLHRTAELRDRHFTLLEKKLRRCKIIKTETL